MFSRRITNAIFSVISLTLIYINSIAKFKSILGCQSILWYWSKLEYFYFVTGLNSSSIFDYKQCRNVLEKELLFVRMLFLFICFEMWLVCLVLAHHGFNICTLEDELGQNGEFPATLNHEFLADQSCTVWLYLKSIRNRETFYIWSFTELFFPLKFFTSQTPNYLTSDEVQCLDKNEKAMHRTDLGPLHMYDSCLIYLWEY